MTGHRGGPRSAGRLVAARHSRPPEPPPAERDPYVRPVLYVTLYDEDHEALMDVEHELAIDRTGWDKMTPRDRRKLLDRAARDLMRERVEFEWDITDPGDRDDAYADHEQGDRHDEQA